MALTDYYVTDAGAGAKTGANEANAMDFATFVDYMVTGGSKTAAAGDRFNIIGSITSRTSTTDSWVNGGTATSPVIIRGMAAGGALGYQGRTAGGGLVTTNMPTITYTSGRLQITGSFIILDGISITSANSGGTIAVSNTDNVVRSCVVTNSSTNAAARASDCSTNQRITVLDCDLTLTGASGGDAALLMQGAGCRAIANRIKGGPAKGILTRSTVAIVFNTIYDCAGIGISMDTNSGSPLILFNTVVGCGGDGIDIVTGTTTLQCIIGNMITDNTGNGIDMTATTIAGLLAYNRFRDNGASIANGGDWITATSYGNVDSGTTGDTATDYSDYAAKDFRLKATSPATSAAQPASASIGALQRDQTTVACGGSSYAYIG